MRIIETARKRILNGNGVNPFFLDLNGVTIHLKVDQGFGAGSVGLADFDPSGKVYTAYDQTMWEAVTGSVNYDPLVDFTTICTTLVNDMQQSFIDSTFNQNIGHFDTSNVTSFSLMFRDTPFNFNINNWDVSNVTNMTSMFRFANDFNQPLNNWDVSSVVSMESMLRANSFNQPLNNWDVSSVTNMNFMFFGATIFNQDLTSWCVEQIPSEPSGFATASALTAPNKPLFGTPC